ncbi:alpha-amylase [Actinobacteria bacterium YIM 96077]|uniref:alpha-amylase n=1 Tax=Phytoactinopolyspora halophila TaxID=1981511 RepID=A0A329QB16_9ACTN|nr:alpha-amylase family glycosyl hydrolase [Phytoactinopolyspora halophila]AYY12457.1 alpha-amylase [Actinobacteria bacterium YIM 96077]RAW09261.1 alpha-amylase [Phytoactinopolyspora halophila]
MKPRGLLVGAVTVGLVAAVSTSAPAERAASAASTTDGATGNTADTAAGSAVNSTADSADYKGDLCYQVLTDRFADGNTSNNDPDKSPGLYDSTKTDWRMYWGGDFAGLTEKLDYLDELGVGALWISPPMDNVDAETDAGAAYHGYWARDFKAPEEHFGTWQEFDTLVAEAHARGIKVVVDFAPNHTSPHDTDTPGYAEQGALYDDGEYVASYADDPDWYFNHNGGVDDWNDRYQVRYHNLYDLSDLRQESSFVDGYMRDATTVWLDGHDVDGVRVDAVKHMPLWWQQSWADHLYGLGPSFAFGEWYLEGPSDPHWDDYVRFTNRTGISTLDFTLNTTVRDVFAADSASMYDLRDTLGVLDAEIDYPENLITFLDNHDMSRFLTENDDHTRLHQALAFLLTVRGTPCVYYGTEQYLHEDTDGGEDPYNRPWMSSFDTGTPAFDLISTLSGLRGEQPAVQYGTHTSRWINDDVYIYERQFFDDVVLVAVNRNLDTSYSITGLETRLAAGTYDDYLSGSFGGVSISVGSGSGDRAVSDFELPAGSVSVWSYRASESGEPAGPQVGSVGPTLTRPGNTVVVDGQGFGTQAGAVTVGGVAADVQSWSAEQIELTVPDVTSGITAVQVETADGVVSNEYDVQVLSGRQVPVVFEVENCTTDLGENCYVTGDAWELGEWQATPDRAIGPMHPPEYPDWFVTASLPACETVELKFVKIDGAGNATWEGGSNHVYDVPCDGVGHFAATWRD